MGLQKDIKTLFIYLLSLVRNPVQEIKELPEVGWKSIIIFQFILSATSVIFSNLLAPFAISLPHIVVSLAASMIALILSSLFFYYFFLIIYNKTLAFFRIFSLVLFAHIPFAIFHLGAHFFPPADLIGLGISGLLMIIGLVENFSVPRKLAFQLMASLYSLFLVYWMVQMIAFNEVADMTLPQDLDKIEREVQNTNQ